MGLAFVLFLWVVVGAILAGVGGLVLGCAAALATRGVPSGRRKTMIGAAAFLPFLCLVWAGCVFVFQGLVNEEFLHRDIGIGDTWEALLPNGDEIMMIDLTDEGLVYNPKTQSPADSPREQEDTVDGVRRLQVAGPYILVAADTNWFRDLDSQSEQVDSYVFLDTTSGKQTDVHDYAGLENKASELGVKLNLEPIYTIYSRYRFGWFDAFAALFVVLPPLAALFLLVRWVLRTRRICRLT